MDLFCGAGGLTHGLRHAGVRVVAGVDFDEACRHPYEANNPDVTFYNRDVAKLKPSEVEAWFGNALIRALAGCAPCQPFSSYSQRYETVGTERWGLLSHFARLVKGLEPDIVTMESVPTVTKHKVFDDFVATLKRLDYKVWYGVVDVADYGLPQRRRRTVLIASLHGEVKLSEREVSEAKTVQDVLKGLPVLRRGGSDKDDPLHTASNLSSLNLERIKASKPGGSWRDWPERLIAKCHRKKTGKTYPGVYGRMKWDEPAPTLTTQFYGFGSGRFGHPTQARGLSLREGANPFRLPRRRTLKVEVATARAFLEEAEKRHDQFIGIGLPSTFISDFKGLVNELSQAVDARLNSKTMRGQAHAGIASAIGLGHDLVRDLDVIVEIATRQDPVLAAAWRAARRIEGLSPSSSATSKMIVPVPVAPPVDQIAADPLVESEPASPPASSDLVVEVPALIDAPAEVLRRAS